MTQVADEILREFEEKLGKANPQERRIAVFGPRSSGKTCYFASLYGNSTGDGIVANLDYDPDTARYGEACWKEYAGGVPGATAKIIPTKLRYQLAHKQTSRLWTVEMLDHAGELIEKLERSEYGAADPGPEADEEWLRDLVSMWLRECEAILIFLDVSDSRSPELQKRRAEVGRLIGLCSEYSKADRRLARPLALVLAKWDCRGPIDRTNPEKEVQRAREFLASDRQFRQIYDQVDGFGANVALFPVSSFGPGARHRGFDAEGRDVFWPATSEPDPYNLLPPLAWAVQQADERRLEDANRFVAEHPSALAKQIEAFETLIDRDGIINGPVHEAARAKLNELYRRRNTRRLRWAGATATLLALAIGLGWFGARRTADARFAGVREFREERQGPRDAAARVARSQSLLDSVWSWALPAEDVAELGKWVAMDEVEARSYRQDTEIKALRERAGAARRKEELVALVDAAQAFVREFAGSGPAAEAGGILSVAQSQVNAIRQEEDRYEQTAQKEPADDYKQAIAHWDRYINSEPAPPDALKLKAQDRIVELRRKDDDRAWLRVVEFADSNTLSFREIHRSAHDYLRNYHQAAMPARHETEAERLIETNSRTWDRKLYNDLRAGAQSTDVSTLRDAAQKAETYLSEADGPPSKAMKSAVGAWKTWYDGLASGTDLTVTVDSVSLDEGTNYFFDWTFKLHKKINLKFGLRVGSTDRVWSDWSQDIEWDEGSKKYSGGSGRFKSQENFGGSFRYRLGDSADVRVIAYRYPIRGGSLTRTFSIGSDQCVPVVLAKGVEVKDDNDRPVGLKLTCSIGAAPRLMDHTAP